MTAAMTTAMTTPMTTAMIAPTTPVEVIRVIHTIQAVPNPRTTRNT